MSENDSSPPNETAGILYAASAYSLWGFLPLYWHVLADVPPLELSFHRMVWCALFGVAVSRWAMLYFALTLGVGIALAFSDSARWRQTLGSLTVGLASWGVLFAGYMAVVALGGQIFCFGGRSTGANMVRFPLSRLCTHLTNIQH